MIATDRSLPTATLPPLDLNSFMGHSNTIDDGKAKMNNVSNLYLPPMPATEEIFEGMDLIYIFNKVN